jgi:nicotinate-nucleotide adenylyltransferase
VKRIGVLAGAFNPVTRAHAELARAARLMVDEIVAVVPKVYPHKHFHGATLEQRIEMIARSGIADRVEIVDAGLFIDIARALRQPDSQIEFICGADAAERVIRWDYGEAGAIERMLEEFSLLVAPRTNGFSPPEHLGHRVRALDVAPGFEDISSTEVRERIAAGKPWEHLVPEPIVELVKTIYRPRMNADKRESD